MTSHPPTASHESRDVASCSLPPPQYQNYMEVYLADKYRNMHLLKPLRPDDCTTYKRLQTATKFFQEGCLVKSTVMGAAGGVMGLLFGVFFFTMRPMDVDTSLPFKRQIKDSYKGFGTEVSSRMKGFARLGFIFSFFDCAIARERARQDMLTAIYAGCATGAVLAWRGGPAGAAVGCAGMGSFSALIEVWNPLGG